MYTLMKRYILTGTPGSGKTSLIAELSLMGFSTIAEAATDVIALEQARGVREPWQAPIFIDKIVALQKTRQMESIQTKNAVQFYDRSPICTHALSVYLGWPPSSLLLQEIERIRHERVYQQEVFFIENLGFCEPTAARQISFAEALKFEEMHVNSYQEFGYTLIRIPKDSIKSRIKMIQFYM